MGTRSFINLYRIGELLLYAFGSEINAPMWNLITIIVLFWVVLNLEFAV